MQWGLQRMYHTGMIGLYLGPLFLTSSSAQTLNWPEPFYQSIVQRKSDEPFQFTGALFNATQSADILNDDFRNALNLSLDVKRDVYNNFDLIGSLTVVDRLKVQLSSRLAGLGTPAEHHLPGDPTLSFPFFGISFGASGSMEWANFNEVRPEELSTLPKPNSSFPTPDIQELNPYLNPLKLNATLSAFFKDSLKPLTLPFRIPFTKKDIEKMRDGEVISYTLHGHASFGASLGWQIQPAPQIYAGPTAYYEAYLFGDYQVSIMRESARYVKVRVARIIGKGSHRGVKVGAEWRNFFQGFFIFKNSPLQFQLANFSTRIIPFSFDLGKEKSIEVDLGYRYDLHSPAALDAFHQAVLAKFARSDSLLLEESGLPSPVVTKLYDRTTDRSARSRNRTSHISFLFTHKRIKKSDFIDTTIRLPDGSSQIFRSTTEDLKSNRLGISFQEKTLSKISVLTDERGFRAGDPSGLLIVAENMMEDSNTKGRELNRYTEQVQKFFNIPALFPVFPEMTTDENSKHSKRANYGRSSFYYGFTLTEENLKEWLSQDLTELASHARELGIHLTVAELKSIKLNLESRNPLKLQECLEQLINQKSKTGAVMTLLRHGLSPNTFENFLVAQNDSFGNINQRSHVLSKMERIIQETEPEMGLSGRSIKTVPAPEAQVTQLSSSLTLDGSIQIDFTLSHNPEFLYFRLSPMTIRDRKRDNAEVILYNRERKFIAGKNRIILDPKSTDPFVRALSKGLIHGSQVSFTIGINLGGNAWGYGNSTQFEVPNSFGVAKHKL